MPEESNLAGPPCPRCQNQMRLSKVKTAIFQGDRVYVVEDIQAMVCDVCMEQYYDEEVTDAIRRLTEEGFPAARATREILVPVFSLEGISLIQQAV